jgi:hypothetical protein
MNPARRRGRGPSPSRGSNCLSRRTRHGIEEKQDCREDFADFSPSHRREYIEWITEAKRPETRDKRIATTLEWLSEGKSRNWKYEKC